MAASLPRRSGPHFPWLLLAAAVTLTLGHKRGSVQSGSSARWRREPFVLQEEVESEFSQNVLGVVGYPSELECDIQPKAPHDQLLLVLWYKEGYNSPIYTFDARGKTSLAVATHYSDEGVFGQRAVLKVPPGGGISGDVPDQSGTLKARLMIQELRPEDQGIFKCRTDFKKSPTQNYKMNLNIMVPPKKPVVHDENGRKMSSTLGPYKVGQELIATCVTSGGTPPPHLTWWREHALIDDSYEVINGQTTNTLQLHGVQRGDLNQVFTCQAINNNQSIPVSTSLRLDISFPPLVVSILGDHKRPLSADREEKMQCQCQGSRPPPIFRWFVGNRELDTSDKMMTISLEPETDISTSLLRYIPKADDNGKYLACRAINEYFPGQSKEDGYIINVRYVPSAVLSFGPSLNPKNIKEGDDVYFECHVKSNPPSYNITWRHNGKFVIENVAGGVLIGNQTLVLQTVGRHNAGLYTCVASNQEGDGESNAQYLNVKFSPQCREDQRLVYGATRTSTALVACFVDANPNPESFTWQFQPTRKVAGSIGRKKAEMVDVSRSDYTIEHDHSVLSYIPASDTDYGVAFCWAENSVGIQREPCRFKLVKESAPDPLRNCIVMNVTWEDMSIKCSQGFDGGHEAEYHVEVYEERNIFVYNYTRPQPKFSLNNLKAGHAYAFLLYASNSLGRSQTRKMNVSTLNLAEKRTAETRSKLAAAAVEAVGDDPLAGEDGGRQSSDPGLALLPIVAILGGVAVGLTSVALGVILLVKGRNDEVNEGDDGAVVIGIDNDPRHTRGHYDAVATKIPEDDLQGEKQIRAEFDSNKRCSTLPHHPRGLPTFTTAGSLANEEAATSSDASSLVSHGSLVRRGGQPRHQDMTAHFVGHSGPSSTSSHSRTVHFQDDRRGSIEVSRGPGRGVLVHSTTSAPCHAHRGSLPRRHIHRDIQFLEESLPLPLPPATFSDGTTSVPPPSQYSVRESPLQQLGVPGSSGTGHLNMENSFVTFCPPNLETKTRDVVNATRL